jgi:hypothetical protein
MKPTPLGGFNQYLIATLEDFLDRRFDARASTFEGPFASAARFASTFGCGFGHFVRLTHDFGRVVAALAKVLRFDIADV